MATAIALAGCASSDTVSRFSRDYRLPASHLELLEVLDSSGKIVGWLYGSHHYGRREAPALSRDVLEVASKVSDVYFEITDDDGTSFDAAEVSSLEMDLLALGRPRPQAAQVVAALKEFVEKPPNNTSVDDMPKPLLDFMRYCSYAHAFGTESLLMRFMAGKPYRIHALETAESRRKDSAAVQSSRKKMGMHSRPRPFPDVPIGQSDEALLAVGCDVLKSTVRHLTEQGFNALSEFDRAQVEARNETMTDKLSAALDAGMNPLAVVGAAHLEGPKSIQRLLAGKGYVTRPFRAP